MSRATGLVRVGSVYWFYSLSALEACGMKDGQVITSCDDLIRLNEAEAAAARASAAVGKAQIESLINPARPA